MFRRRRLLKNTSWVVIAWIGSAGLGAGQTNTGLANAPGEAVLVQVRELRAALDELRDELSRTRRESQELREELQAVRQQLDSIRVDPATAASRGAAADQVSNPNDRVSTLDEERRLLQAKVDDQYQTKVESSSKYRVRLSGLALLNVFSTVGSVDNLDVPRAARPQESGSSNGSFGATARQSLLSLGIIGPQWLGAKTSGDLSFDFFGGFPSNPEGVTAGLVRLRTAKLVLDWANTSLVGGQDAPFFAPLSPTSFASMAYPAFSSSGNMWTWTPQVHVEHRVALSEEAKMIVQWGILDPLTGELPAEYNRIPTAGEQSRIPAFAVRLGWQYAANDRVTALGAGAYYSRQSWGFGRTVDAWAATSDWDLPFGRWFSLSGEAYRGKAIGGLGAGVSASVLFRGSPLTSTSSVLPLNSAGGWAQLKFKPAERIEFNAAFGEDYPFRTGLQRLLQNLQGAGASRNASGFFNVIYQPRSNLVFSLEYRRLWTSSFYDLKQTADHVSLSSGIIF